MNNTENKLVKDFQKILKEVCGNGKFALHEPYFSNKEKKLVQKCIDSSYVSSIGEYTKKFELKISKYTQSKYCICVVNGTSALHLALLAINLKVGEEVIVPALSFVATANAIRYCGAEPHFVDIDDKDLGIDPLKLEKWLNKVTILKNKKCFNRKTGKQIRAIIPVHVFGNACSIKKIIKVAKKYHLEVIEDAAESLGTWHEKKHTGTFGKIGIFSFNGNKIITTGGGGAIVTNDKKIAAKIQHLSTQAKVKHLYDISHNEVGYNYRMPNINAALGIAQFEKLNSFLKSKRKLFKLYEKKFKDLKHIELITNKYSNNWLISIKLDKKIDRYRNKILISCNKNGFQIRPTWKLLNKLKIYKESPSSDTFTAENLSKKIISLPSSAFLVK